MIIGRSVRYWPAGKETDRATRDPKQPYLAFVIFVHTDSAVDLMVWNHYGDRIHVRNVKYGTDPGQWSWF